MSVVQPWGWWRLALVVQAVPCVAGRRRAPGHASTAGVTGRSARPCPTHQLAGGSWGRGVHEAAAVPRLEREEHPGRPGAAALRPGGPAVEAVFRV